MDSEQPRVPDPKLSFWMDGEQARTLCRTARNFWQILADAAIWPARQNNPLECSLDVLGLIAWQRCVTRYHGESERLFRLRVTHAYANAVDAGQTKGWSRIFRRLELGELELLERVPGQDWDRVGIVLSDERMAALQDVLEVIIQEYGRTCRRYYLLSRVVVPVVVHVCTFDDTHETVLGALAGRMDHRREVLYL